MTQSSLLGCLNVVIDSIGKKRSAFEFAEVANKNDHSHYYVLMSSYLFKSYNTISNIKCEFKKECPLHLSLQKLKQNNTSVSYMAFHWSVSLRNLPSSTLL